MVKPQSLFLVIAAGMAVVLSAHAIGARAQARGDRAAFEAASIKVVTNPMPPGPSSPDRFNRANASLRDLIAAAYGVQPFEILGGPDWLSGSVRFDVAAKAGFIPSPAELRTMLQRLLADRFALRTHPEMRDLPVYVLRTARADGRPGSQLTRTTDDCAAIRAERARNNETPRPRMNERPVCAWLLQARQVRGAMTLRYQSGGLTLHELAAWMSPYVQRPVVDRTALDGEFDVDLSFSPRATGNSATPADPDDAVSVYTAVEEQLGLKLESTRATVSVVVVDDARMPTPD